MNCSCLHLLIFKNQSVGPSYLQNPSSSANPWLTKKKKPNSSWPQACDCTHLIILKAAFPLEFSTAKIPTTPVPLSTSEAWPQLRYVICNLHTRAALTSSAGITGLVKSTQVGLQGSKPNHIWLFLKLRNTTSPCPPQFNTNSLAAMLLVLGFRQQPSGEITKLCVPGQKESAGMKTDPDVITQQAMQPRGAEGWRSLKVIPIQDQAYLF